MIKYSLMLKTFVNLKKSVINNLLILIKSQTCKVLCYLDEFNLKVLFNNSDNTQCIYFKK